MLMPFALMAQTFSVPLTKTAGQTFSMPVSFDGVEEVRMVLDSGAAFTTLEVHIVESLVHQGRAVLIGKKRARLANGEICPLHMYEVDEMWVGDCLLKNVIVATTDNESRNLFGLSSLEATGPITIQFSDPHIQFSQCGLTALTSSPSQ